MQAPPERDAVGRRGRNDRAQPRHMFIAYLASFAASSESVSPAARREFRGSGRTSRSGVLSTIIRLCEKPRHYKGAVVTSPAPTHPITQDRPPLRQGQRSSGSGAASHPRTGGFEDGAISPSGISRVVQSNKFATIKRAQGNDCVCTQLRRSWINPVGPQRVRFGPFAKPSPDGRYLRETTPHDVHCRSRWFNGNRVLPSPLGPDAPRRLGWMIGAARDRSRARKRALAGNDPSIASSSARSASARLSRRGLFANSLMRKRSLAPASRAVGKAAMRRRHTAAFVRIYAQNLETCMCGTVSTLKVCSMTRCVDGWPPTEEMAEPETDPSFYARSLPQTPMISFGIGSTYALPWRVRGPVFIRTSSTSCHCGFGLSLPVERCSLSVRLTAISGMSDRGSRKGFGLDMG